MNCTAFILCHKLEKYVDRAIASVITQTRLPDQIVLVGTDCRDETCNAFQKWTAWHSKIQCRYSPKPLTCAQSKNFCAKHTGIPYSSALITQSAFFILDADDWLMPRFVDRCMGYLETGEADAVGCDYQLIHRTGRVSNADTNTPWETDIAKANPMPAVSIVRQSAFQECDGYREDLVFEDWAYWIKMRELGKTFYRYPQILFNHVRHETNITNDADKRRKGYEEIQCLVSSTTAKPLAPKS